MSISNFTELKSAITDWMKRDDLTGDVETIIQLAEAKLNREVQLPSVDATLTGTIGSRRIDVSSLSVIEPIALYITVNGDEREVTRAPDSGIPYEDQNDEPALWGMETADYIDFDVPLDEAYSFRLIYEGRYALSDANPTNRMLTDNPDVYFAACLVWGGIRIKDGTQAAGFEGLLSREIPKARRMYAQLRRTELRPPEELAQVLNQQIYTGKEY